MNIPENKVMGIVCIALGALLFFLALGNLLLRFIVALIALMLINYGLRLQNMTFKSLLTQLLVRFKQR